MIIQSMPKKANSEAARKFLEKEKSESVDGTTRKKKIREKEFKSLLAVLKFEGKVGCITRGFTQPLKEIYAQLTLKLAEV